MVRRCQRNRYDGYLWRSPSATSRRRLGRTTQSWEPRSRSEHRRRSRRAPIASTAANVLEPGSRMLPPSTHASRSNHCASEPLTLLHLRSGSWTRIRCRMIVKIACSLASLKQIILTSSRGFGFSGPIYHGRTRVEKGWCQPWKEIRRQATIWALPQS